MRDIMWKSMTVILTSHDYECDLYGDLNIIENE